MSDSLRPPHLGEEDLPSLPHFADALRELGAARDPDEALQIAVDLATELVPGVDVADVMFSRPGGVTTPVATDKVAIELDQAQQAAGHGPCLSILDAETKVVAHDLAEDDRWPAFAPEAVELGYRSVIAYQLFVDRGGGHVSFGAMNLFGREPGIAPQAVELGEVFAAHCSGILNATINAEGLTRALQSRDIIGQAKGILMERHRIRADEAYQMLRRASNNTNLKVRELARRVTETGQLPTV